MNDSSRGLDHVRFRSPQIPFLITILLLSASIASATTQLLLTRDTHDIAGEYKGVVELVVDPGVEAAKVTIAVDGQKIATGLLSPWRIVVDFGPSALEHRISVTATTTNGRRVQWHETVNRGLLPLTVKLEPLDLANRLFAAKTTAPENDPVQVVQLWQDGQVVAESSEQPYRITAPPEAIANGFVQVTARTKSGEEAADFWSATGDVHAEEIQVRTVPLFVSVVDRSGQTHDDVDRALFRVLDNESEATIVEFGKAFDQPISIALLIDASASMTYSMESAVRAAKEFASRTLKAGDKCSVTAIQDVPRRKQTLTGESTLVAKALDGIKPMGRTALFDALSSAIRELKEEKNRRAIVVLTDGTDTSSIASYNEIRQLVGTSGIPIYFIAYEGGEEQQRNVDQLKFLAEETGGFVAIATEQNLPQKYHEIEKDLRAQFAIRYQITDFAKSNEWRTVHVQLKNSRLTARTIKGYFTP
ncbi:MAG TPA: VWA domain-containing protein [Thermoanaerobaculia bacterium]|nr:VWA domain-containing protein [Thermoanaerobaculia bacterium]